MARKRLIFIALLLTLAIARAEIEGSADSEKLDELRTDLHEKVKELLKVKKEVKSAQGTVSDAAGVQKKLVEAEQQLQTLTEQAKAAEDKVARIQKDFVAANERASDALAAKEAAEKKLKKLESAVSQSQTASSEMSGRAERAESRLAATEKSLSEVEARLQASHETIKSLETEKEAAQKEIAKLTSELNDLREANKELDKAQTKLQAAQKELEQRAGKSETSLKGVQAKLKAAEAAAAAGQKALAAAESKAESAAARLEDLLRKASQNWLPLWLEEHYNKGVDSVGPFLAKTQAQASNLLQITRSKLQEWWKLVQAHVQTQLKKAGPTMQTSLTKLQASWSHLQRDMRKHAVPLLQKTTKSIKSASRTFQSHPQVVQGRRWLTKQVQELKSQIATYLKMHPITASYAKEPVLTYLVYAAVVLPLVLIWLTMTAIAGLFGSKKGRKVRKPPKRLSASSSTTGSVQGVKNAKATSKKGRRITMGEDSIRVPE